MKVNTNNRKRNDKETVKINIGVSILLAVVLSFISVGYAVYGQKVNIFGNVTFLNNQGVVAISGITFVTTESYNSSAVPAFSDDSIDFNLTFAKEAGTTHSDYRAVFEVTIDNDTWYDYAFNLANFQPVIQNSQGIDVDPSYLNIYLAEDGPQLGDSIPAGESITFQIYMDFNPPVDDTYTVEGNMGTDLEEQPHGSVIGTITGNDTGDLRESLNHNIASFTVDVINSYQSTRTFTLSISDPSHFQLVNSDGTALSSFTIASGTEQTYTFYVKRVANAVYAISSYTVGITLAYNEGSDPCGNITLTVDESQMDDTIPPKISDLTVTLGNATSCDTSLTNIGAITLEWKSTIPASGIDTFYATAYDSNNIVTGPQDAGKNYNQTTQKYSYTFSGLANSETYYFQVYGQNGDGYGDSSQEIANYGAITSSQQYYWKFAVNITGTNIQAVSNDRVNKGCTYNKTINAKSSSGNTTYYVSSSSNDVTAKMGDQTLTHSTTNTTQGYYKYTPSSNNNPTSASISVYDANGKIDITVPGRSSSSSSGC